jgi:hypothetical protein
MPMLYNKIKFEIDIHIDKLLGIIWEHIREIKKKRGRCGGGGNFARFRTLFKDYTRGYKI